jgi:hypothetical protein
MDIGDDGQIVVQTIREANNRDDGRRQVYMPIVD